MKVPICAPTKPANPRPAAPSEIAENIDSASAPEAAAGLAPPTRRRYTASWPAASTSSRHRAVDDHVPPGNGMRQPRADF